MRSVALATLFCFTGCATIPSAPPPIVPVTPEARPETRTLPMDPAVAPMPDGIPKGEWTDVVEVGACLTAAGLPTPGAPKPCPMRSGILLSEEKASRDALYRIDYKELRLDLLSDEEVWRAERDLYEKQLVVAEQKLQAAQPSWYDNHKMEIGILLGSALGAGMAVGVVYAIHPAFK